MYITLTNSSLCIALHTKTYVGALMFWKVSLVNLWNYLGYITVRYVIRLIVLMRKTDCLEKIEGVRPQAKSDADLLRKACRSFVVLSTFWDFIITGDFYKDTKLSRCHFIFRHEPKLHFESIHFRPFCTNTAPTT